MLHFDGNPFYQLEGSASSEYAPSMTCHQDSLICQAPRLTSIDSWDEEATGKVLPTQASARLDKLSGLLSNPLPSAPWHIMSALRPRSVNAELSNNFKGRLGRVVDFLDLRAFEWFSFSASPPLRRFEQIVAAHRFNRQPHDMSADILIASSRIAPLPDDRRLRGLG
jgi:hypothetical protein